MSPRYGNLDVILEIEPQRWLELSGLTLMSDCECGLLLFRVTGR